MASFGTDRPNFGELYVQVVDDQHATAFFVPTARARELAERLNDDEPADRIKLVDFDLSEGRVHLYPLYTLPSNDRFLTPKYGQILKISTPLEFHQLPEFPLDVEDALRELPNGLTKDFQYGLGFLKAYKVILDMVEMNTECTVLSIGSAQPTGALGEVFNLTQDDFDALRSEIDRIASRSHAVSTRVKSAHVHNELATSLGLPPVEVRRGRHPVTQLMTDVVVGARTLDSAEQDGLIGIAVSESRRMAETRPEALAKLKAEIDLVTLETLIDRFELALTAGKPEPYWQKFFEMNPFALHLAFGYTVIQVRSQASVGGRSLSGEGDKIADYLVKNPESNNVGIFEIKRPKVELVRSATYRGGVHAPTQELAGSITQILDQRYQLQRSLTALKESSRDYELEQYAIGCCLVIGQTPTEPDEQKSFELFRHSLKDVAVVTYDELLAKLKQLRELLQPEPAQAAAELAEQV
jgi:hypothetical protein